MDRLPSEILDRVPPNNQDAEKGVLGSMLLDERKCDDIASLLRPEDFYAIANGTLYGHIIALHNEHGKTDPTLLLNRLEAAGDLEKIGGSAYIADVLHSVPHAGNATYYAKIVREKATLRKVIAAGTEMVRDGYEANGNPTEILDRAESELSAIELNVADNEPVSIAEAAVEAIARIDRIIERGRSAGVPTGLIDYDRDHGGLFPGELTILAARPGVGKTSLALQIAEHNGQTEQLVYFASLEMSRSELSIRQACGYSGVSNRLVRTGRLEQSDQSKLSEAFSRQAKAMIDIDDRSALTVAAVRRAIRKRMKRGLSLVVIDYLQLVTPGDRKLPREQQVAGIVRQLKETAREHEIPILCLCQLNRQSSDEYEIPKLSQLRESGAIEQDADVVWFISKHKPSDTEYHNSILMVAKNRNGETGPLRLNWDGPRTRFSCPELPANAYDEFGEFT